MLLRLLPETGRGLPAFAVGQRLRLLPEPGGQSVQLQAGDGRWLLRAEPVPPTPVEVEVLSVGPPLQVRPVRQLPPAAAESWSTLLRWLLPRQRDVAELVAAMARPDASGPPRPGHGTARAPQAGAEPAMALLRALTIGPRAGGDAIRRAVEAMRAALLPDSGAPAPAPPHAAVAESLAARAALQLPAADGAAPWRVDLALVVGDAAWPVTLEIAQAPPGGGEEPAEAGSRLTVRTEFAGLGRVDACLALSGGLLSTVFRCHDDAGARRIRQRLPHYVEALEAAGIAVGPVSVTRVQGDRPPASPGAVLDGQA